MFDPVYPWGELLTNIAWELRSLTNSTINDMPGRLVFNRDILFDLKYVADWEDIHQHK